MGKVAALVWGMATPVVAEPVQIAALGDSLTQGYGLVADEGLVPQLQAWLNRKGAEVTLVNAGVSGDTTAGGLARIDWTLTPEVEGLIVTLGGNDLLRGIDPAHSRENLSAILSRAEEKGVAVLLVGMTAPGNFGPEFKAEFDAIYPELAEDYGIPYAGRFFDAFPTEDPAEVLDLMQPDGIHPNAAGVSRIVEELGPDVLRLVDMIRKRD
ncbi:arylesterase [Shimia biformata]|uniref:arylesterase n=1 Tax=Shimia biformata TaxID=1294299 RepID=UPI00194E2111